MTPAKVVDINPTVDIKSRLAGDYMRGYRAAVSGQSYTHGPVSNAFEYGYTEGTAHALVARHEAEKYAARAVAEVCGG